MKGFWKRKWAGQLVNVQRLLVELVGNFRIISATRKY